MKYLEFKDIFAEFLLISSSHIFNVTSKPHALRDCLTVWQKRGLIIKLRKGLYILNEKDRKIHPSRIFLANSLYSPSYVSTEYALGYYDLIPEKVEDVTSITTKKTAKFTNSFGTFLYQHLKTSLFFGFTEIEDENELPVFVAEPENAGFGPIISFSVNYSHLVCLFFLGFEIAAKILYHIFKSIR